MDIINLFNKKNITYDEAETILDVVHGMIKDKRCKNNDIVSKAEKINWDRIYGFDLRQSR